jgi:Methyltransferase domain
MGEVELLVTDMTTLNFPPGSFDVVVAFYSIIHLPRNEQKEMLGKIATWLSRDSEDGGYLLLNFGTTDNPGSYEREWLGCKEGHMYWSSFDSATNLALVEQAEFEIVESSVIEDDEDGRKVPFLWVLARKR